LDDGIGDTLVLVFYELSISPLVHFFGSLLWCWGYVRPIVAMCGLCFYAFTTYEPTRYVRKKNSQEDAMIQNSVTAPRGQQRVRFVFDVQPKPNRVRRRAVAAVSEGLSEEQLLVARAKSGQGDAFGELYKRHQHQAYCTALRVLRNHQDAEDAVQRSFQRALVNVQRFRGDSSFSTWLTRIVINDALMALRQRRTRDPHQENSVDASPDEGGVQIADGAPTPLEVVCESERHATLRRAVGELRESLRVVVLHGELQGLTSAETAQRLGLTVAAVKTRTFHARRFLRKRLGRDFARANGFGNLQARRA
jgi:RNA polymerase sigma-70 factor, ECF subfamily